MVFSDILANIVVPVAKLIVGNGNDQYNPGPKHENIYRECLYRTLDTLDGELTNRKIIKQQERPTDRDIPSQEMILRKLQYQPSSESEYDKAINKDYKWSCKI